MPNKHSFTQLNFNELNYNSFTKILVDIFFEFIFRDTGHIMIKIIIKILLQLIQKNY